MKIYFIRILLVKPNKTKFLALDISRNKTELFTVKNLVKMSFITKNLAKIKVSTFKISFLLDKLIKIQI